MIFEYKPIKKNAFPIMSKYDVLSVKGELCHFGIRGQKWGIRRYQNEDGTLTEEGKRHYGAAKESERKLDKVREEGKKLFTKDNPDMSWDMIDDWDLPYMVAQEYGKRGKAYVDAYDAWESYERQNRDSIKIGEEIIRELNSKKK
jgi:hypothetical protein